MQQPFLAQQADALIRLAEILGAKPLLGYLAAIVASALAAMLRWWLGELVGPTLPPFITFYPVVMLAALLGGMGPGLLATGLSALAVSYIYLPPIGLGVTHPADQTGLAIFCAINVGTSAICAALRNSHYHSLAQTRRAELSEQRLRATFQQAAVGILEVDTQDRITAANQRAYELLGYPADQLVGMVVHDLTHPADRARSDELNREIHDGRQPRIEYEKRYLRHDGSSIWVQVAVSTLRDAQGRDYGSIGTFQDITARKQMEEALRQSERQFRALTDSVPQLVWTTDAYGQVDYVNTRWLDYTGQTPEQAHGTGWAEAVHPEDRDDATAAWRASVRMRQNYEGQYRLRRHDGQYCWFLSRAVPFLDPQGKVKRWFGSTTDIDEQKHTLEAFQENQDRLRLAVETAELGMYERDILTNQVVLNATCQKILGATEPFPADLARRAVHPDDRDWVLAEVARAFDPNLRAVCSGEFRIIRPDGTLRWLAGRGRVLFREHEQPPAPAKFIGVLNDITERKEAEAELECARDKLTHANAHLDSLIQERTAELRETIAELEGFSYSLVHDMRAPLRAMLGFADILEQEIADHLDEEHSGLLHKIKVAALRMDQLVTDSFNYSRILRQNLPLCSVRLDSLIRGLLETYPNLQPPGAEISLEIPDLTVYANEAALTQVFSNLLGNAVKFVAPGVHPRIRVWASTPRPAQANKSPTPPPSVLIWIEDNGIGIPKDQQQKIFGMFQRLHRVDEYPGTGIGLALVRKSLDRIGGKICLESEPGHGSRFCVQLPLAAPDQPVK